MDFLDPAKKRAHATRLIIGYVLIAAAIAVTSLILLFQSYGYDLDRKTGSIIQNGLVFVSAHPEGAQIYVNGQDLGGTDAKLPIPAGQYTFELKRKGYRNWKRTFYLEGGSVERLTYPILFPEKLTSKDVQLYSSVPTFATVSPDRHWLVVQQPQDINKFDVFDLSQKDPNPVSVVLPDGLLTKADGAQSLSLVEWSTDNKHVLIKHTYNSGFEFVILDRENAASSLNINKQLNVSPAKVVLRDKHYDQWYVYDDKTLALQTADLKAKQPQSFLAKVLAFKSYGSGTMLYVADDDKVTDTVALKLLDGSSTYKLRSFPKGSGYALDIARYNNDWFITAAAKSENIVSIYKNPQDTLKNKPNRPLVPTTVLRLDHPAYLSFSANTQFIAAQSGSKFAVYDAEKDRRYYYELPFVLPPEQQARWMDGDRLAVVRDNKTLVFDYDGINQQTLSAANPGFEPFFDQNYTTLYSIAPSVTVAGRAALTSTSLKVTP
jgi:hypothetical protein